MLARARGGEVARHEVDEGGLGGPTLDTAHRNTVRLGRGTGTVDMVNAVNRRAADENRGYQLSVAAIRNAAQNKFASAFRTADFSPSPISSAFNPIVCFASFFSPSEICNSLDAA